MHNTTRTTQLSKVRETTMSKTADTQQLKAKTYCPRCTYEMWYNEQKKRWYCTNPKCVRYKPQPTE
jgi:ribosomal protein S27AE